MASMEEGPERQLPVSQAVGYLSQEILGKNVYFSFLFSFTFNNTSLLPLGKEFCIGTLYSKPNLEYDKCVWGLMSCNTHAAGSGPEFSG